MKEYLEKFKELDLVIYAPTFENDATLANWYKFLVEQGDFVKVF